MAKLINAVYKDHTNYCCARHFRARFKIAFPLASSTTVCNGASDR